MEAKYYGMTVHIWNFDKDIKIERKKSHDEVINGIPKERQKIIDELKLA